MWKVINSVMNRKHYNQNCNVFKIENKCDVTGQNQALVAICHLPQIQF